MIIKANLFLFADTVHVVTQQLVNISQQAEQFDEDDAEITALVLDQILQPAKPGWQETKYDSRTAINLVKTFSNLLQVSEKVLVEAEKNKRATSRFVWTMQNRREIHVF